MTRPSSRGSVSSPLRFFQPNKLHPPREGRQRAPASCRGGPVSTPFQSTNPTDSTLLGRVGSEPRRVAGEGRLAADLNNQSTCQPKVPFHDPKFLKKDVRRFYFRFIRKYPPIFGKFCGLLIQTIQPRELEKCVFLNWPQAYSRFVSFSAVCDPLMPGY